MSNRASRSFLTFAFLILTWSLNGQTPTPSPTSDSDYTVRSSIEIGYRWRDISGDENKYRSDLNYGSGVRVFDSSFFIERNKGRGNLFDEALITTSGWGGDPTGMFRANLEKGGAYRFNANVRRVRHFNDLFNFVNFLREPSSQHNANITHNFGDFDAVIFPESEKLRVRIGYSYNRSSGLAGYSHRAYSDEFGVESVVDAGADDFRFGAEGRWLGFNMGFNYGHRDYRDRTFYFLPSPSLGNTPTNNARLDAFSRTYPIDGDTEYVNYFLQRTFAERFDLTARIIYSFSDTDFTLNEAFNGRNNSNQLTNDEFQLSGTTKRSQIRGDVGATWRATEKFRVSNTYTIDDFDISGSNNYFARAIVRTAAGAPVTNVPDTELRHRSTAYRRHSNLLEADYQFNSRFALNVGYRFTHRQIALWGFDADLDVVGTEVPYDPHFDESDNTTHTFLAGVKIKPVRNWSIFGDFEHGSADSIFTRLGNNDVTNYRVRSVANFDKFTFNVSAISKRSDVQARSLIDPTRDYITEVRNRTFSTSVDWQPVQEFSLSGGYTYQHLTSIADIRVPLGISGQAQTPGVSEFYIRDSYYFIDANVNFKRVGFFGSYRFSDDDGQGSRVTPPTNSANIITSYPMQMHSPEFRFVFKLHRNIDWNVGYHYYKYRDVFTSAQNYNAHLPYTSVRFYFGKSADR